MADLTGMTVAFLLTDGFEDSELTSPWDSVLASGGTCTLVSPAEGAVTGEHGHSQAVDVPVSTARPADFDALVLPGGVGNADSLRLSRPAVEFTRSFFADRKPVAVICHGAWILAEADVLRGRTLTSYPSLRTDLQNAGATWMDEEVVVDHGLVSSRTPHDLPAFNTHLGEQFAAQK